MDHVSTLLGMSTGVAGPPGPAPAQAPHHLIGLDRIKEGAKGDMKARGNAVRHLLWLSLLLGGLGLLLAAPLSSGRALAAPPTQGPTYAPPDLRPQPGPLNDPYGRVQGGVVSEIIEGGRATYIVMLDEQADTQNNLTNWADKGQYVYDRLTTLTTRTQQPLLEYLEVQLRAGHVDAYESLWIVNAIVVTSDVDALNYLANQPEVRTIWPDESVRVMSRQGSTGMPPLGDPETARNIVALGAPQVWELGNRGNGVVVAMLDTGVEATHPALARKYRGWNNGRPLHDYNWYDAVNGRQQAGPYDDHGHGTHTTGIVLGSEADNTHQIGVAPGAQWIAVKMLDDRGEGTDALALRAMQWVLAPTRGDGTLPRPDLRPQVVSNSWGAVCADAVTRGAVRAWTDAGIFASFASGDEGELAAPAAFPEAFAVGAVDDQTGEVALFNGVGPSCYDGSVRPQILAPGVSIHSSLEGGYSSGWSGSSMAQAHIAGVAALIIAARPDLSVSQVRYALTSTAGFEPYMGARPNNSYGWGLVAAAAAYRSIQPATPLPTPAPYTPTGSPPNLFSPTPLPTPPPEPGCQARFDDVPPSHWAASYIQWFYCRGYVSGYGNNRFGPDRFTSRAQFAKMIVLSENWPLVTPATPSFVDVPSAFWAYAYIETARAHGVVSGYADGTFEPVSNITRGQLAKILVQSQGWTPIQPARPTYSDVGPDHWAFGWVETVYRHRVASGYSDGSFRPRQYVTRAQLSKMLYLAVSQP
jgi:subtilisin family serine protease